MRIIVRSKETNLWLPIPLFLANTAVLLLPESVIEEIKNHFQSHIRKSLTKISTGTRSRMSVCS